jgi:hypothetical protein
MNVRTVLGMFAWMMSSNPDVNEDGSLVSVSADKNSTKYLLSRVQRINANEDDTNSTISIVTKYGDKKGNCKKSIYASHSTKICGVEVQNVYVFPIPVSNTLYVNGVDEDDTNLIVYDINGNCIFGEYGNEIEVDHLQEGIYILGINDYFVRFTKSLN